MVYGTYGTYNELVTGANLNQLITGGAHIVGSKKIPIEKVTMVDSSAKQIHTFILPVPGLVN